MEADVINGPPEEQRFLVVNGRLAMKALGNRVIVMEDRIRTGFECKTCDGFGYDVNTPCAACKGSKLEVFEGDAEASCRVCQVGEMRRPSGHKLCETCKGRGGLLIVPQQSERRPTSGLIYTTGPDVGLCFCVKHTGHPIKEFNSNSSVIADCQLCSGTGFRPERFKVGDHVLYGNYAGYVLEVATHKVIRVMHEDEIFAKLYMSKGFSFSEARVLSGT